MKSCMEYTNYIGTYDHQVFFWGLGELGPLDGARWPGEQTSEDGNDSCELCMLAGEVGPIGA